MNKSSLENRLDLELVAEIKENDSLYVKNIHVLGKNGMTISFSQNKTPMRVVYQSDSTFEVAVWDSAGNWQASYLFPHNDGQIAGWVSSSDLLAIIENVLRV